MGYQLTRPTDLRGYNEQMVQFVNAFRENSVRRHQAWRQTVPELYDVWRGILRGKMQPYKNNLHIPLLYSSIWGDVARKMTASWGRYPFVSCISPRSDMQPAIRRWEGLLNGQLLDANVWEKEILTFLSGDLYGVAVSKVGWMRDVQTLTVTQITTHPVTGQPMRVPTPQDAVLYDGPDWEPLDILNFYPDPDFRTIKLMRGAADRSIIDYDDVRRLASGDAPLFDPAVVQAMYADNGYMPSANYDQPPRTFAQVLGLQANDPRMNNPFERPVEIIEYWGEVPSELALDGDTNRVLTVANRRYLLRNTPNPYRHRLKPYVAYHPTQDPHHFYAPGKAEVGRKLQMAADKRINQNYDAADFMLDPTTVIDRNAGVNTQNLFLAPGTFIDVDGPPGEAMMPFPHDHSVLVQGQGMVQDAWRWLQLANGVSEDMGGGTPGSTPDRETARSAMARVEAQGTRLAVEQQSYEYGYAADLLAQVQANDVQFCPLPRQVEMMGPEAVIDPITGMPDPAGIQSGQMTEYDFAFVPRAVLAGGSKVLNEGQTQQLALQFFQMVQSNPVFQQAGNWPVIAASMSRILNMPEVREWFLPGFIPGTLPPQQPGAPSQPPGAPPGTPEDAASQNMQMGGSY